MWSLFSSESKSVVLTSLLKSDIEFDLKYVKLEFRMLLSELICDALCVTTWNLLFLFDFLLPKQELSGFCTIVIKHPMTNANKNINLFCTFQKLIQVFLTNLNL